MAGNFSAYWLGMAMLALMAVGFFVSTMFPLGLMLAPAVFSLGLVAFGFLGMGPVTIAVDSYGPVTDNAQSVYELSTIEAIPGIEGIIEKEFGFKPQFERPRKTWKRTMVRKHFQGACSSSLIGEMLNEYINTMAVLRLHES